MEAEDSAETEEKPLIYLFASFQDDLSNYQEIREEIFSPFQTYNDEAFTCPVTCNSRISVTSLKFKLVKMVATFTEYVNTGIVPVHYHNTAITSSSDIPRILQYVFAKRANKLSISLVHINHITPQYQYFATVGDCQYPASPHWKLVTQASGAVKFVNKGIIPSSRLF
ncbi:uncharacterized protein LOC144660925 [Oculina patagonica]